MESPASILAEIDKVETTVFVERWRGKLRCLAYPALFFGRRTFAKPRSAAMKRSNIGTTSLTGSIATPPSARRRP